MMDKLFQSINKLPGSEARNLLVNIMIRIKNMRDSKDTQEEMLEELYSLYDGVLGFPHNEMEREFHTIHISCGESTAGSLRYGLGRGHKVIGYPDFLAVGPIWELHKDEGRKHRYEWLKDHLNIEMNYIEEEYEQRITKTFEKMNAVPENVPIVIWTAENANEQTGMRYIMQLLEGKPNDIFLINTSIAHQELFATNDDEHYHHTGVIHPERLKEMYEKGAAERLSTEEIIHLQKEWVTLSGSKAFLRIWRNREITSVSENHFDSVIITTIKRMHDEQGYKDFILASRIIGEVLVEEIGQSISDVFLEYRIRELVYTGVFEIKGIPKNMRAYSVRLVHGFGAW